jgi:phospholipase C
MISRWVVLTCVATSSMAGACGASSAKSEATAAETPWNYGAYSTEEPPDYDIGTKARRACKFTPLEHTSDTIGTKGVPDLSPIKHVVLVLLENRSFDHYFATLKNDGLRVEDVAIGDSNPGNDGNDVHQAAETRYCLVSPRHEWADAHLQYDDGAMDGFVAASSPNGEQAMSYYTSRQLPFYHYLGETFAISARHFSSLLGPTEPNRLFYYLGTSCNYSDDIGLNPSIEECGFGRASIFKVLDQGHVSYTIYDESNFSNLLNVLLIHPDLAGSIEDFEHDAAEGTLSDVSIVGASTGTGTAPDSDDDHPPANPELGQEFLARVVKAIATKALWENTALIVTFDENGGFYDHVPPPKACNPEPSTGRDYDFDQLGFRVPLMVVSAWARKSYTSHFDTDHTSILRFLEHWKDLPALTRRDANAWPLLDLFQFDEPLPMPDEAQTSFTASQESRDGCAKDGESGPPPAP